MSFEISSIQDFPDSVRIKNIDQGTELVVSGNDTVHLKEVLTGLDHHSDQLSGLALYPNPMKFSSTLTIHTKKNGEAKIRIIDLNGRVIAEAIRHLHRSENSFEIRNLSSGLFFVNVLIENETHSEVLISFSNLKGVNPEIIINERANIIHFDNISSLKTSQVQNNLVEMKYNDGEEISLTGYYQGITAGLSIIPDQDQVLDFTFDAPQIAFTADKEICEAGIAVQFTDQSTNSPDSWEWDFGDGNTSTAQNPSHVYESEGVFTVVLKASNIFGENTLTKTDMVDIGLAPIANFDSDSTLIQPGGTVKLNDLSENSPTDWEWNFGNQYSQNAQNPEQVFNDTGTFDVTLKVSNKYGTDSIKKAEFIKVGNAPENDFDLNKDFVIKGTEVRFTDKSTNNPQSWEWDFGDGSKSTEQNPTHVFSTEGSFTVTLYAINEYGKNVSSHSEVVKVIESEVTDIDGNTYGVVIIGTQAWLDRNLMATHYADGTAIPNVTGNNQWKALSDGVTWSDAAYCWYNNDANTAQDFGAIYSWAAAAGAREGADARGSNSNPSRIQGVCPDGFHLPSNAEWDQLYRTAGGHYKSAIYLRSTTGWLNNNGEDRFGFNARPGAIRNSSEGIFGGGGASVELAIVGIAYWWSSTHTGTDDYAIQFAKNWYIRENSDGLINEIGARKSTGYNVRCVRD